MPLRGLDNLARGRRPALLISECQRGVVDADLSPFPTLAEQVAQRGIVPRIAELAQAFRTMGLPVLHLHVAHRPDCTDLPRTSALISRAVKTGYMRAGSPDVESVAGLPVLSGDHLQARRYSLGAFNGTELDTTLRHLGVGTLVLTGVSSNVAVNVTALTGSDLGYQVLVPEDCIAGASAESHDFVCRQLLPLYATLTSQAAVLKALQDLVATDTDGSR
jgi:nicotinamidase-related amidase